MNTKQLLIALSNVLPAVEKKTVISQYDHFVFYKGNISTYNGKIFFSHPVDTDINCSVVASDMLQVIKSIDSETVELTLEDQTLTVKSDDVEAELSTEVYEDSVVQAITSMNLDSIDWKKAGEVPKDFITGLSSCRFSVSKDASDDRNLDKIHIFENVIESGDGFRCSEFIMDGNMEEVLIPAPSAAILCNQNPEMYIVADGWMHFIDKDDVIFSVRVGSGDFPDTGKIIESIEADTYEVTLPPSLKDILVKFTSLSDSALDVYKFVQISIKDGELSCSTKKDTCNITKKMSFKEKDVAIEFFVSPVFLSSIMEKTSVIRVNSKMKAAIFSEGNFTHVIVLPEN